MSLLIGTWFNFENIRFEMFGGDFRKRSILNQLVSQMIATLVVANWLTLPVTIYRITVGSVASASVYWFWCFVTNAYTYGIFIPAAEHLLIKYISVVVLKRLPTVQDDFFGLFLFLANQIVSAFLSIVNCCTRGNHRALKRIQGLPMELAEFTPLNFE